MYGKYQRNTEPHQQRKRYDEDHKCDVYDFLFKNDAGQKKLADTEPYFYGLQGEISRILRHVPEIRHSYFDARQDIPAEQKRIGSIVITADKGLAGAYNHNIIKLEEEILAQPGIHKLFVVGELGRHYFAKHNVEIDTKFPVYRSETHDAPCQRYWLVGDRSVSGRGAG